VPEHVDVRLVQALQQLEQSVRDIHHIAIHSLRDLRAAVDRDLDALPRDADPDAVRMAQAAAESLARSSMSLANVVSVSVQREADRLAARIQILDQYAQ